MKSILLAGFTALIVLATILYFDEPASNNSPYKKVPGSFKSLFSVSQARANGEPLEGRYMEAWRRTQRMKKSVSAKDDNTWEAIGPINIGARTLALAVHPTDPDIIWAGAASGGLWKSETGGLGTNAWTRIPIDYPILGVSAIAINPLNPDEIYIGTGEVYGYQNAKPGVGARPTRGSYGFGIFKTTDGGQTWEPSLDWTYDNRTGIQDLELDPNNPEVIWAATTEGVYRSGDSGASWVQMHDVIMATSLVVFDEQTVVVACGGFASEGHGFYRTSNGGDSWQKITDSALPETYHGKAILARGVKHPNRVWATIGNGFSIYATFTGDTSVEGPGQGTWTVFSDDFGLTWELYSEQDIAIYQGWYSHAPVPTEHRLLLLGVFMNYMDDNNQIQWPDIRGTHTAADFHAGVVAPSNGDIVYVAADQGVFRSENGGRIFEYASHGFQTAQFYLGMGNSPHDDTTIVGCPQDYIDGQRYLGEKVWGPVGCDESAYYLFDHDDPDAFVYGGPNLRGITASGDSGTTNPGINSDAEVWLGTSFNAPLVQDPVDSNRLYAARSKVYMSSDRGRNWTALNNDQELDGNPIQVMAVSASDGNTLYAATEPRYSDGHVFRTTDGGQSWTDVTGILPKRHPTCLEIDPQNPDRVLLTFSGFGSSHLYETLDGGTSWRNLDNGRLPDVPTNVVRVDHQNPEIIYVGNDLGVFVTRDNGATWSNFSEGLPSAVLAYDLLLEHDTRIVRLGTHGNGAYAAAMLDAVEVPTGTRRGVPQTPRVRDERLINRRR